MQQEKINNKLTFGNLFDVKIPNSFLENNNLLNDSYFESITWSHLGIQVITCKYDGLSTWGYASYKYDGLWNETFIR